ncbi:MAG: hypothetical protein ABUT39_25805 [Acidobacteriota bacterium]
MDLDDLKTRLAEQDAKLDQVIRLNTTAIREIQISRAKTRLWGLVLGVALELAVTAVAVVWLGDFIAGHLREARFLLPAVLLDLCAIAKLAVCIRQLAAVAGLSYSLPVVAVQKELGKLRVLRLRALKWEMILWFVLWLPALVVLFEGFFGVDLWFVLGAAGARDGSFLVWVAANVAFGLAVALLLIWLSKRYADRVDRSPALRRFVDSLAGTSLTKALDFLDSVVQFETEPAESRG